MRYVTALGETDDAGGWRENKAHGGVLIDVASGETVLRGLSMPHSPRWHDGRLWLLDSGNGTLSLADLDAGSRGDGRRAARLHPRPRCLPAASRSSASPRSARPPPSAACRCPSALDERLCGVWAVDTRSGETLGFLRFEELVQEIFDVALLTGLSWPEIAEESSDAASHSFVLPD